MSEKIIKKFESEMKDFQDRLSLLETKIKRLEKTPEELEILRDDLVEVFGVSFSALDIDSSVHDFRLFAERVSVDVVKTVMGTHLKRMKEFAEKYDRPPWKEVMPKLMERWTYIIFMVASIKQVEFDDFCSIVIENLGSDLAKKIIALEDVVKFYGAKNATIWKRLTK